MKKAILGVIIVIVIGVAALVLATPVALAGNWNVKISKVSFTENINTAVRPQVSFGSALTSNSTTTVTALEYYYSIRSGGSIVTTNNNVNSTAGNFTGTISWSLANPSNATVSQGNYTFAGGYGNRTHTFTFSSDQGLRASGTYRLTILLSGIAKTATSQAFVANDMRYTWKVP